jgi:hypothetical protein
VAHLDAPEFGLASKGIALESGKSECGFGGHGKFVMSFSLNIFISIFKIDRYK